MSDPLWSIEAERAVLGSMLLDPALIPQLAPQLRPDDFGADFAREIYEQLRRMSAAHEKIDPLLVAEALGNAPELRGFLAELLETTPTAANAAEYAEIVAETGKRRRLYQALDDGKTALAERRSDSEVAAELARALEDYNAQTAREVLSPIDQIDGFYGYRQLVEEGGSAYTRTGFRDLDRLLGGGMMNGGLYFLAARPGVGKTALALNIAENVAKRGDPVCFISLEMTNAQLMARRIAMEAALDSKMLLTQKLTEEEHDKVAQAVIEISKRRLYVTEALMDVGKASAIARARKGLRLAIIDHFTLFLRPHRDADHAEYAAISHDLAHLAKSIGAPVLCLIQLSRASDMHKGRARLSELRGSGATEEDAAGVLILHRTDAQDEVEDENPVSGDKPRLERVYLDKNRFGDTGSTALSFWPKVNRFRQTYA